MSEGVEEWGNLQVYKKNNHIYNYYLTPVHYFYIFAFSFSLLPVNMKIMFFSSYFH